VKVLQQLIQHFWMRGVLSDDQAHYLVESGFIRPRDLEDYEPRPEEDRARSSVEQTFPTELFQPDELERTEEELTERQVRRKGERSAPKVPELKVEELAEQLRLALAARSSSLGALCELASRIQPCWEPGEAAILLRQLDEATFNAILLNGIRTRSSLLAELWEAVDLEPFHVVASSGAKGRVIGAFQAILRATGPEQWGPAGWLLQVAEMQTVTNLLAVRRRMLPALVWLYDHHWNALSRCMQKPARPLRSWRPLGHGLVLLYNARGHAVRQKVPGYALNNQSLWEDWHEAWTVAMAFDPAIVTPYVLHVFGSLQALRAAQAPDLDSRDDLEFRCPSHWKM
jgi:hypothetical protein